MYNILEKICTSLTSISAYFWPWNNGHNPAKRIRDQVVDISEDDEDEIFITTSKKLKLLSSSSIESNRFKQCAITQTDGMARNRSLKDHPRGYQSSTKENWQVPVEVIDLIEDTPNKFNKNPYRPPQHVRSPHRNRRKSFNCKPVREVTTSSIISSTKNRKILREKQGINNKPSRTSWPITILASGQSSNQQETLRSFSPVEIQYYEYLKMLNSYVHEGLSPVIQSKTSIDVSGTIDLTAEDGDDSLPTSTKPDKKDEKYRKIFVDCSNICLDDSQSLNLKHRPNKTKVKPKPASIEIDKHSFRNVILVDDDDEDEDEDCVQIIKTTPVAKTNSLEAKIKARSLAASTDWTEKLIHRYEVKKSEMDEMTKRLSAELNIVSGKAESNFENVTLKLLSKHLELTECYFEDEEVEQPQFPELTPKMMEIINNACREQPQNEIVISMYGYSIKRFDIKVLTGTKWLNDEIMNFYTTLIMERSKTNPILPKTLCFNTFFYVRFLSSGYAGVRRWTKKIDFFSYDLVLIPIHLQMHWCLAAIDLVNLSVNYYDSMGKDNDQCLNALLDYVQQEYKDKKGEVFDVQGWTKNNLKNIPQQMNCWDCGVFCCTFAEFLARRAKFTFSQKDMPYLRQKMIYEVATGKLLLD